LALVDPTLITPTLSYRAGVPGAAKPAIHVTPVGAATEDSAAGEELEGLDVVDGRGVEELDDELQLEAAATHTAALTTSNVRGNPLRFNCTALPFRRGRKHATDPVGATTYVRPSPATTDLLGSRHSDVATSRPERQSVCPTAEDLGHCSSVLDPDGRRR